MLLSYVLRLVPTALAEGRLAGTLQTVDSGQTATFSSLEELLTALLPLPRESEEGKTIDLREAQRLRAAGESRD